MNPMKEFDIPFEGLKIGKHLFEYHIDDAFFESFENSIIQGGEVLVDFVLEKKETLMIGEFSISGIARRSCDRCNDLVGVPVSAKEQMFYKFEEGESEDENLIYISPSEFTINVAFPIYELITVSLPIRSVHKDGECNQEMIELLKKLENPSSFKGGGDQEIDARWEKLKKLK